MIMMDEETDTRTRREEADGNREEGGVGAATLISAGGMATCAWWRAFMAAYDCRSNDMS